MEAIFGYVVSVLIGATGLAALVFSIIKAMRFDPENAETAQERIYTDPGPGVNAATGCVLLAIAAAMAAATAWGLSFNLAVFVMMFLMVMPLAVSAAIRSTHNALAGSFS